MRSSVASTMSGPVPDAGLLDRVARPGAAAMTPSARGSAARAPTRSSISPEVISGRAASWTATSSVPTAARALDTDSARVLPPATDAEIAARQLVDVARRCGDHDRAAPTPQPRKAAIDHATIGLPATRHEGLRTAGSEPLSGAGGRDDRCDGCCRAATRWWRSAPPAARRGTPRRPPRPCRART